MKEINDIINSFDKAQQSGKQTALATVVQVEGSSYRRPGARMLITDDGQLTGAISGGCLEGDALRKALLVMSKQEPMLVSYDTRDEDDAKLGVGLGCNGIIHILIEPVDTNKADHPVQLLKKIVAQRQQAVLITLFDWQDRARQQPGTCFLQLQQETFAGNIPAEIPASFFKEEAQQAFQRQSSSIGKISATTNNALMAFVEFIPPTISLVIAGAGNDVMPLVQMANLLGWQVTVADGRANYATAERFPAVHRLLVAKPEQLVPQLMIDEQTVVVLMTHNYNYDLALLQELLPKRLAYLGVLGPKKKLEYMLDELFARGIDVPDEQLGTIYGPVGLDIGAETAEEIALSIMAEIKSVLSHREGGSLRNRPASIHPRSSEHSPS